MRKTIVAMLYACIIGACGPGEMGPPGPAGPQGPKGDPGAPGIGLTKRTLCSGSQLFGAETVVAALYLRYDFADGSAFVQCYLYATNGNQAMKESIPVFYKSTDPQIAQGDCDIGHDVDNATASGDGVFELRVTPGATTNVMTYRDRTTGDYDGTQTVLNCETT